MEKEDNKVNFDLSLLSLKELTVLYEKIVDFSKFLDDKMIVEEEKVTKND